MCPFSGPVFKIAQVGSRKRGKKRGRLALVFGPVFEIPSCLSKFWAPWSDINDPVTTGFLSKLWGNYAENSTMKDFSVWSIGINTKFIVNVNYNFSVHSHAPLNLTKFTLLFQKDTKQQEQKTQKRWRMQTKKIIKNKVTVDRDEFWHLTWKCSSPWQYGWN